MRLVFDIETDGLDPKLVHCMWAHDILSGEWFEFKGDSVYKIPEFLNQAECLIGHNIIGYDIPAIERIFRTKIETYRLDTLILAQMVRPMIHLYDISGKYFIPKDLVGSHSLKAYGYRLNSFKGEFNGPWDKWTQEMHDYCKQDVEVTKSLFTALRKHVDVEIPLKAINIELDFAKIMERQQTIGVPFDTEKARELETPITQRRNQLDALLRATFPKQEIKLKTKTRYEEFNPNSRKQVLDFFVSKYSWIPEKVTKSGNPKLDSAVLESLPFPECKPLLEYYQTQKLLSMLSEGDESWFKYVKDGRIHGHVNTLGAVTGRCTHSAPNLAQVPSSRSFMGKEVRSLFYAPEGHKMVGVDAAGLELRCLAHFMAAYDYGAYAEIVTTGDVHTKNQKDACLATRDISKRFIYCMLYGGGDEQLGSVMNPEAPLQEKINLGKTAKKNFFTNNPAFELLLADLNKFYREHGCIYGIDGRRLVVRHKHALLNTLLQNCGAVVMKLACNLAWQRIQSELLFAYPVLNVHDEMQTIAREDVAERVGVIKAESIREAGLRLSMRCELKGEYKIGNNWSETH